MLLERRQGKSALLPLPPGSEGTVPGDLSVPWCLSCAWTHLARRTHGPIQGGALLGLAKVGIVRVAAPQLLAGVKGPELKENTSHWSGRFPLGVLCSPRSSWTAVPWHGLAAWDRPVWPADALGSL